MMKVKDIMTTEVLTARPDTSVKEIARTLAQRRISGVPVIDEERRVLGVVSEGDVLFKQRGSDRGGGLLAWLLDPNGVEGRIKLEARTAEEAMTSPAVTIEPQCPVWEAARTMIEAKVNRLPVVQHGRLVGIVSRADLVRAFARSDEEIVREIREDVLQRTLWIVPESVDIEIAEGEVRLKGRLETKTDAELLQTLAGRVPGVVSVSSDLSWRYDDGRAKI